MGSSKIIGDSRERRAEVGDAAASGLHIISKPTDVRITGSSTLLGHYKVAGVTGAIGAGASADSQVLSFRWASTTYLGAITKIRVTGMRATTAFAAGVIDIKATVARSFSAAASGGTSLTLTGNNQKLRTSFGTTATTDIRIATTAALTAGTQTLDSQDIGIITTHSSAGVGVAAPIVGSIYIPGDGTLFQADIANGEHPLLLAANEGFVVRATVPATGVWNIGVEVVWAEVETY